MYYSVTDTPKTQWRDTVRNFWRQFGGQKWLAIAGGAVVSLWLVLLVAGLAQKLPTLSTPAGTTNNSHRQLNVTNSSAKSGGTGQSTTAASTSTQPAQGTADWKASSPPSTSATNTATSAISSTSNAVGGKGADAPTAPTAPTTSSTTDTVTNTVNSTTNTAPQPSSTSDSTTVTVDTPVISPSVTVDGGGLTTNLLP